MLEQVGGVLGRVGHLVRSCHERWDGDGYPDGLAEARFRSWRGLSAPAMPSAR